MLRSILLPMGLVLSLSLATADASARLVYQRPASRAIVVARDDGSQPHAVAHGIYPRISPNGKWVTYYRRTGGGDELRIVSAAGGSTRRLLDDAYAEQEFGTYWSPDSRRLLAMGTIDRAVLFNLRKGTKHGYRIPGGVLAGATFSPDSSWLLMCMSDGDEDYAELRLVRAGHSHPRRVRGGCYPQWTPLGIVFHLLPNRVLLAKDPDSTPHDVAKTKGTPIAASRDGRRILAELGVADSVGFHADLIDPVAKRTRHVPATFHTLADLSRDGRHILGTIGDDVVDVRPDGRVHVLVENAAQPAWNR